MAECTTGQSCVVLHFRDSLHTPTGGRYATESIRMDRVSGLAVCASVIVVHSAPCSSMHDYACSLGRGHVGARGGDIRSHRAQWCCSQQFVAEAVRQARVLGYAQQAFPVRTSG